MAGHDTVRGIGFQQAQAVIDALSFLTNAKASYIRVEGAEDILDLEILNDEGELLEGKQYKTRSREYAWSRSDILEVLTRWVEVPGAIDADFTFVTDGRLGPSAYQLFEAIQSAKEGKSSALCEMTGASPDSDYLQTFSRVSLRQDHTTVEALRLEAERQILALLPRAATISDTLEAARKAFHELFTLLFDRSGNPDADVRRVTRSEIMHVIGIDDSALTGDWQKGSLRAKYLESALKLDHGAVVEPYVKPWEQFHEDASSGQLHPATKSPLILLVENPAILFSRPGTGKTTACNLIVQRAAAENNVVVHLRPESYMPGRFAALIADAVGDIVDVPISMASGRQILEDDSVTLLIDGASEIPSALQEELAKELYYLALSRNSARIVLVGRDVASLHALLPRGATPTRFTLIPFSQEQQRELVMTLLSERGFSDKQKISTSSILITQAKNALGDASQNPLLFTMAVKLLLADLPIKNQSDLYEKFINQLAEREGAVGIAETKYVLGAVFSKLLDAGKRHTDHFDWKIQLQQASEELTADYKQVEATSRATGLVSSHGYSQTIVPLHDTFADYLAGLSHAKALRPLPQHLSATDDRRLQFTAEIGGVTETIAFLACRDLPLTAVSIAQYDRRDFGYNAVTEVEELFAMLDPFQPRQYLKLYCAGDQVTGFISQEIDSGRVGHSEAQALIRTVPSVSVEQGPLGLAVALWRRQILENIRNVSPYLSEKPKTLEESIRALERHTLTTAEATNTILGQFTEQTKNTVSAYLPLSGLIAHLEPPDEKNYFDRSWRMKYTHAPLESTDIGPSSSSSPQPNGETWGETSVWSALSHSPQEVAAERIVKALNTGVGFIWI